MPTWTASAVTYADWGRPRVVVDGVDVTFFRGKVCVPKRVSWTEPFDDDAATFWFPQITAADAHGSGDLGWLRKGVNVEVYRVLPDGTSEPDARWEGILRSIEDHGPGTLLDCVGQWRQMRLYRRAPQYPDSALTVRGFFNAQLSDQIRPAVRFNRPAGAAADEFLKVVGDPSGFVTRRTGSWNDVLDYMQFELALMQDPATGVQWTLELERPRIPVLRLKDTTTVHWTIPAALVDDLVLKHDWFAGANVIYGEGVDRAGEVWRNVDYASGIATYAPLAIDPRVTQSSAKFDPAELRIEKFVNFGAGVDRATAIASAQQMLARDKDPGWTGHVRILVDPNEGSRWDIKRGQNIRVTGYRGVDPLLHISEVVWDLEGTSVTLQVDSKARDRLTVGELLARSWEGTEPTRKTALGRGSAVVEDTRIPWDTTGGSGYIPFGSLGVSGSPTVAPGAYIDCPAGTWTQTKIFAAQRASVRQSRLVAYNADGTKKATPFVWAIFKRQMAAGELPPDPTVLSIEDWYADWPVAAEQGVFSRGEKGQRAGYHPRSEAAGGAVTGEDVDDGTWQFSLDDGHGDLWVAIWPVAQAYFQGRLHQGVN